MQKEIASLQFITHYTEQIDYLQSAMLALQGGCKWVQLRMKHATDDEICIVANQLREACHRYNAKLILDDKVYLVKQTGADGVHLGKNDMPIDEARHLLGADYIIGGTANTFADAQLHWQRGADYIGCGPFRYTTTKEKLAPTLGLEGYSQIMNQLHQAGITLPVVAIGGIEAADIPALMQTGVTGIALSGTIIRAENPVEETRKIIKMIR